MKEIIKKTRNSFFIIIIGVLVGFVLLLLAYEIPTNMMEKRVSNSSEMLRREFENDVVLDRFDGTYIGTFTDCLMLQNAIYDTTEHSVFDSAIHIYRRDVSQETWEPGNSLIKYLTEHTGEEVSYTRYWHGYLTILKPALLFFDFAELRLINIMFLAILSLGVIYLLYKNDKYIYSIPFCISAFSMYPTGVYMSLSQSVCVYIMLISMIVYLKFDYKINTNYNYIYFFVVAGLITSYMDLLTYPILPFASCLILFLIMHKVQILEGIKYFLVAGLSYFVGYIFMWAGKWVLASAFGVKEIWKDVFSTIAKRSGNVENAATVYSRLEAINANLRVLYNKPLLLVCFVFLLVLLFVFMKKRLKISGEKWRQVILFLLVALIPFGWYFFAANHSYIHAAFTFRGLSITVFAVLASFVFIFVDGNDSGHKLN